MAAIWQLIVVFLSHCVWCNAAALSPLRNAACGQLAALYPNNLYWEGAPMYYNETQSFWSKTTILEPYCVFSPETADDVAAALSVCVNTQTQFAVRGNGHMTVKGAASTNQGVLIALTKMRAMSLNNTTASLGPGLTWFEVYNWIQPYGRTILGGRYAPVGVSGYLLGGGISYYSGQHGWAANSIKNYEIVTADSKVQNANDTHNTDLFWALKGGSNNFGIVTRFDVETYPGHDAYAGTLEFEPTSVQDFVGALRRFVEPGGGIDDPSSAILPNIDISPQTGQHTANAMIFSTNTNTTTFNNLTKLSVQSSTAHIRKFNDFVSESVWSVNRSFRNAFFATSLKASAQSIDLITTTLSQRAVADLNNITGSLVALSIQPIGVSWLEAARAKGGDAINLDAKEGSLIAMNLYIEWMNESDDVPVTHFAQEALAELDAQAQAAGLYYPFIYINDSGTGESPFALYGNGTSLDRLKKVRAKYDPSAVFQRLQPGGFKTGI